MTLPLLGPMTLSGFAHSWFFLFLFVVAGLVALYILMQLARQLHQDVQRDQSGHDKQE